jgi:hypothetical protein
MGGGCVTTGGAGIPRLQEVSYLEVAAQAVHDGSTFEEIRQSLIAHMAAAGALSQGSGNTAARRNASTNPTRYVLNVTEALKELMKLGLLAKATLPSTAKSAHGHRLARYQLTDAGEAWVAALATSRRAGYDQLTMLLLDTHPQFKGFLSAVGAISNDDGKAFIVPLIRWGDVTEPRTRERYVAALAAYAARGVASGSCGWAAGEQEIAAAVGAYVQEIATRAAGRQKPDPFARNQAFVTACEEAMVKFAFGQAGIRVDSISVEILRRWTGTLALVNFSYHAPGPQALRLWPTATVMTSGAGVTNIQRRVGEEWRARVPSTLRTAFDRMRRNEPTGSLWVPIYRIRAAVCWELRIPDSEFDTAVLEMLREERGADLPFRVNLDQSSYGSLPPSERPLIVTTRNGPRVFKSLSLVARAAGGTPTSKGTPS